MRDFLKIKDSKLVRDPYSNAILNTDDRAIKLHEHRIKTVEKNLTQENKINKLEAEMSEMKGMLKTILERIPVKDN